MSIRGSWKPLLLASLIAFVFGGCDEPTTTAPSDRAIVSHDQATNELPFRFDGDGVFLGQDLAPGFPEERSTFEGRCSTPADFVIRFGVEGESTQLGKAMAELEHCTQIDFATGLSTFSDGILTIIAANGDELWTRYTGLGERPGQPAEEYHDFNGGTGRFVGATGEAVSTAVCDRAAGTCVFQMEGVIVYDAADRAE